MSEFNILIPFEKSVDSDGTLKLFGGIASSTSVDRDNERMDKSIIKKIAKQLEGATVFFNHNIKGLGVGKVKSSQEVGGQVSITVIPTIAKGMTDVITQIGEGILKSFSIGGRVLKIDKEFDENLNKEIKVIKDVEIYEVSVVGIPANADASIQSYISKSLKKGVNLADDENKTDPPKEDPKKDNPESTGEKVAGLLESPEFKKILSDFKTEFDNKFVDVEKQLVLEKDKNEELIVANKALTARVDELHEKLNSRVKSLQTEQIIEKDTSKSEDTKKDVNDEPVRFL